MFNRMGDASDSLNDINRLCQIAPADAGNSLPGMKTIFIDCNPQLGAVWKRVIRPDDPAVTINNTPFEKNELPRVIGDHDIAIDDHSYMPTDLVAAMQKPQAHRVPRHRRRELHERGGARSARRQGPHHQGLWRHRGGRADHRADDGGLPRSRAHGPQHPRRHLAAAARACRCSARRSASSGSAASAPRWRASPRAWGWR